MQGTYFSFICVKESFFKFTFFISGLVWAGVNVRNACTVNTFLSIVLFRAKLYPRGPDQWVRRFLQLKSSAAESVIGRMVDYSVVRLFNFEDVIRTAWVRDVLEGIITRHSYNLAGHLLTNTFLHLRKSLFIYFEHDCQCVVNGVREKVFDTPWVLPPDAAKSTIGLYSPRVKNRGRCDVCAHLFRLARISVPTTTWMLVQNVQGTGTWYSEFAQSLEVTDHENPNVRVHFELFGFALVTRAVTSVEPGRQMVHQVGLIKVKRSFWFYDDSLPEGRPVRCDPRQLFADYYVESAFYFRR